MRFVIALLAVVAAGAQARAEYVGCRPVTTLGQAYYPDDAVGYGYFGADAQRIIAQLELIAGDPAPALLPVTVFVGLDLYDNSTDFWLYSADGCLAAHLGPAHRMDFTLGILNAAGVAVPFGATYHQVPGLPA